MACLPIYSSVPALHQSIALRVSTGERRQTGDGQATMVRNKRRHLDHDESNKEIAPEDTFHATMPSPIK